jgi:hypothetical protein
MAVPRAPDCQPWVFIKSLVFDVSTDTQARGASGQMSCLRKADNSFVSFLYNNRVKRMYEPSDKFVKMLFWIAGITVCVFFVALLMQGTRKGERKAKLSSRDFSALNEIESDQNVLGAVITNVRILYVVAANDGASKENLARHYCAVARKNHALIEQVRVVEADSAHVVSKKDKPDFLVLAECNCSEIRVR